MLEKYEEALSKLGTAAEEQHSVSRYNRCIIDAALEAGIAEDVVAGDEMLELPIWQIREHSKAILDHVKAAKAPPAPN